MLKYKKIIIITLLLNVKTILTHNNIMKDKTTNISHVHFKQIKTQKTVSFEILKKCLTF